MPSTDLAADLQRFLSWATASPSHFFLTIAGAIVLWNVVPFIANTAAIAIPGPIAAKFSDFWLMRQAMKGKRFQVVHDLHSKHGMLR
jgi:benzoate 4-monooxygenase